jgi:hypothetical protein
VAIRQILVDDLDGGDAAETKTFSYDGVAYEIDLSGSNITKLEKALKPYIDAARKSGRAPIKRTKISSPQSKHDLNAIRSWARGRGKAVSDRGRIPKDIVDAFNTEHESTGSPAFSNTP